jgi:hypothetical protein
VLFRKRTVDGGAFEVLARQTEHPLVESGLLLLPHPLILRLEELETLMLLRTALLLLAALNLGAQTLFVDAVKGRDDARGTRAEPLATLERAAVVAGGFAGDAPVTVKIAPGLYVLSRKLVLRTAKAAGDSVDYTLEATVMPDDPDWQPEKMPIIQSTADDNSTNQFSHSVGLLAAKDNIHIKGLKFLGNANPRVQYYYPIARENEALKGLEVSQSYFIGEKNSSPIQSAIWAHGAGIHVDHTIFYGCKNALVLIKSIREFSMTHSIVAGAYEAAVWYGDYLSPFVFRDNIVTECNYFWVRTENTQPAYAFSHSLFTNNRQYMGFYDSHDELHPIVSTQLAESDIRKSGQVILVEVKTNGLPRDYLNLSPESDGRDIQAGIFKQARK